MPSVNVDIADLLQLTGAEDIPIERLESALLAIGAELKTTGCSSAGGSAAVDVLANRPDMFTVEGIARAVEPFLHENDKKHAGLKNYTAAESGVDLMIDASVIPVRPIVVGAVVRNAKMNDRMIKSLMDMQEKLHLTVGRKRAKVSIGVHDSACIHPPYTYKAVDPDNVRFVPLGMDRELSMREILNIHEKGIAYSSILEGKDKFPVLMDSKGAVLSFPPIINGTATTVTSNTKEIFIDVTGTHLHSVEIALNVMATALIERGMSVQTVRVVSHDGKIMTTPDLSPRRASIGISRINSVLGTSLSADEAASCLRKMRYGAEADGENVMIVIPCYRSDILHEIDIIEDVGIGYGYENIAGITPKQHTFGKYRSEERLIRKLEHIMASFGFIGTFTPLISNENEQFVKMCMPPKPRTELLNPTNTEQTCLRLSLLPSLLSVLSDNRHRELPQKLFEAGDVIVNHKNSYRLSFVATHSRAGFTECKSLVQGILSHLLDCYEVKPFDHPSFIDGRCAEIVADGKHVGFFGEISPEVLINFDLGHPTIAAEIDICACILDR